MCDSGFERLSISVYKVHLEEQTKSETDAVHPNRINNKSNVKNISLEKYHGLNHGIVKLYLPVWIVTCQTYWYSSFPCPCQQGTADRC